MDRHNWVLEPLRTVANEVRKKSDNIGLDELINVIEAYSAEVGSNETEQIDVLEYMVAGVGPLHRKAVREANPLYAKSHVFR